MFGLTGGIHCIIIFMAASTTSKWMDDVDDGQCPCMQYSPINPYAFINNHILQSSMPRGKINKPRLEESETGDWREREMKEDSKTEEPPSSSSLDNFFGRHPDDHDN